MKYILSRFRFALKHMTFRRGFGAVISLLPLGPVLLCGKWFAVHRRYPLGDNEALMLFSGLNAYHKWVNEGILQALNEIYWNREFKPILHPVLALPALMLSSGNVRIAVAVVNLFLLSIFMVYLYKMLRFFLPQTHASVGACLIGFLPWVIRSAVNYGTELPILAAGTATVYYLLKSNHFTSKRECSYLGVAAGFAFCFHPGVATIGLGAALLAHSMVAVQNGALRYRDVAMAVILGLAHIVLGIAMRHFWFKGEGMDSAVFTHAAFVVLLCTSWIWMSVRGKLSAPFLFCVLPATFMVNGWYLPFLSKLYHWINMGFDVPRYGSTWTFRANMYKDVFSMFGRYALIVICLVILFRAVIVSFFERGKWDHLKGALGMFVALIFLPMIIGSLTHNKDMRYYYFYFTMAYSVGVIVLYYENRGGILLKSLRKVYLLFGVLGALAVPMAIFNWHNYWLGKVFDWMSYAAYNVRDMVIIPNQTPEPGLSVSLEVAGAVPPDISGPVGLAADWSLNPEEMGLICLEHNKAIDFECLFVDEELEREAQLEMTRKSHPFLIVGPCEETSPVERTSADWARLHLNENICRQWREGSLSIFKFEVLKKIQAVGYPPTFLLLKSMEWNDNNGNES